MAETLTEALERIAGGMEFRRFLLPDGVAALDPPAGTQPCDRLLFVMHGVKREPMSLGGEAREIELAPGDAYLVRKNVWEYCSVATAHRLLCIVPRNGFLRVSYYDYPAGMHRGEWCDPEAVHSGRPVPQPLLAVFAALGEPGGEAGSHVPHLLRAAAARRPRPGRRPRRSTGSAPSSTTTIRIRSGAVSWRNGSGSTRTICRNCSAGWAVAACRSTSKRGGSRWRGGCFARRSCR